MKIRKNFIFESGTIKTIEKIAAKNKRSLTKQLEIIMEAAIAQDGDEFFEYMDKRNADIDKEKGPLTTTVVHVRKNEVQ